MCGAGGFDYAPAAMTPPKVIELFFDIGSPYSYLAATQIEAVAANAEADLRLRPFLLGGVFKSTGNTMPAALPQRGRYMLKDLERCAARYGVPFKMSRRFPLNTLLTQRALCAVAASDPDKLAPFMHALFRGYWVEDRDVSSTDEIAAIAAAVGLDGAAVLKAAGEDAAKTLLRANTDEAVARGAFGAPTIFVGDEMFWGNDRLSFVEETARRG